MTNIINFANNSNNGQNPLERRLSSREIAALNTFHSDLRESNDKIVTIFRKCNLFSNKISFYYDGLVRNNALQLTKGLDSYIRFLLDNKLSSSEYYDFINIDGELFFGIDMFCFPDNGSRQLHRNAFALFYADDYVVNLKGNQYYPIWMLSCVCNNDFFKRSKHLTPKMDSIKTYIMLDNHTGYYKIGKSKKPLFREKTLRSDKPNIDLLFFCDGNIESRLHKQFSIKKIRGEWFDLSTLDLKAIFDLMKSQSGFTENKVKNIS